MICIVLAQNVMCLYVQMCMSVLRVFIIFSGGRRLDGFLFVCCKSAALFFLFFFQFVKSQDMLFTALFLAWY